MRILAKFGSASWGVRSGRFFVHDYLSGLSLYVRHAIYFLQVKVPAGVEPGNKLRVKGEGDAGAKGGPVGDLYVFLGVKNHPKFKRAGKDIYSDNKVRRESLLPCRRKAFFCIFCIFCGTMYLV